MISRILRIDDGQVDRADPIAAGEHDQLLIAERRVGGQLDVDLVRQPVEDRDRARRGLRAEHDGRTDRRRETVREVRAADRDIGTRWRVIRYGAVHGRYVLSRRQREPGGERRDREKSDRGAQIARHGERSRGAQVGAGNGAHAVLDRGRHHLFGEIFVSGLRARERARERDRGRQAIGEVRRAIDPARDALVVEPSTGADDRTDDHEHAAGDQHREAGRRQHGLRAHGEHRHRSAGRGQDGRGGGAFERTLQPDPHSSSTDQPLDRRGIRELQHAPPTF